MENGDWYLQTERQSTQTNLSVRHFSILQPCLSKLNIKYQFKSVNSKELCVKGQNLKSHP